MAVWNLVLIVLVVFLAVCSAAPSDEKTGVTQEVEHPGKLDGYEKNKSKLTINDALTTLQKQGDAGGSSTSTSTDSQEVLSPQSDWHNCPYITKTERIYAFIHENETDLVVQTPFMNQYVTTVRCAHEYIPADKIGVEECFQDLHLSAMGSKTICKTTYGYHTIFMYNATTNKIIRRSISIPVCCSCVVSYD